MFFIELLKTLFKMNKETLFYLLPEDIYPNILKYLDKDTRVFMLCLIYYGHNLDLWYKWYPKCLHP